MDDELLQRLFAERVMTGAGWHVTTVADGASALALLESAVPLPSVVLLDIHMMGMSGLEVLTGIRARQDAAPLAVIAFTTTRLVAVETLQQLGFDGVLAKPCTPDELLACAARWAPGASLSAVPRLEQLFGEDEIRQMIGRFRALLLEALEAVDAGDGRDIAHRVAGVAGTLGFAAVGRLWLALSEGHPPPPDLLRRLTHRVIADIDQLQEGRP